MLSPNLKSRKQLKSFTDGAKKSGDARVREEAGLSSACSRYWQFVSKSLVLCSGVGMGLRSLNLPSKREVKGLPQAKEPLSFLNFRETLKKSLLLYYPGNKTGVLGKVAGAQETAR